MAVAAAAIGHNALLLVGVAFLCFGIGEWINRPIVQSPYAGNGMRGIISAYPWQPRPFGLVLDGIAIALFLIGTYRLVFP